MMYKLLGNQKSFETINLQCYLQCIIKLFTLPNVLTSYLKIRKNDVFMDDLVKPVASQVTSVVVNYTCIYEILDIIGSIFIIILERNKKIGRTTRITNIVKLISLVKWQYSTENT